MSRSGISSPDKYLAMFYSGRTVYTLFRLVKIWQSYHEMWTVKFL